MKSPQEWKKLLENINFPNFNKSDNEEVMEFIFSNCKQRDALLTWIAIQLGATYDCRVLKHEVIVEYLKKRRIAENKKIKDFVEASLPKFDQEVIWDKLFSFMKMQKRLIPQPYGCISRTEPAAFDISDYNERSHDHLGYDYEPVYKELDLLKNFRKKNPSVLETKQCSGDRIFEEEYTAEKIDTEKHEEIGVVKELNERSVSLKNIKKYLKYPLQGQTVDDGKVRSSKRLLPTGKVMYRRKKIAYTGFRHWKKFKKLEKKYGKEDARTVMSLFNTVRIIKNKLEKNKSYNPEFIKPKKIKKPEKYVGDGKKTLAKELLPTETTSSGTWYSTRDGIRKVFVPVGAPKIGEFSFDPKTMRIVCEDDRSTNVEEVNLTQQMEELEKRFRSTMLRRNRACNYDL
ncbi:uncharacterized protein [Halyomorpha halys]|uniref:uncharacterized protein n=1 Tax=Halyomorpha halys TaxID=286706 RepID=UPI0006D4CCB2|nr:uncharacterized protein LOC106684962 [Halyomorpha halys]